MKRELQKIDLRDPNASKHHYQNTSKSSTNRRNYKTSPCSSSSDSCSSTGSGSESGSESYTSCSSSCSSSSFSDENVHRQKNYKNSSINQTHQRTDKFANTSSSNLMRGHTPPPIHQQPQQHLNRNVSSKRYHQPSIDLNAAKRLRSRSPQSTTSSYYSRKSNRAGPLTPPLPNSHHSQHSLSNSNTPSSSINKLDMSSNSNVKLDRHGNVRVSLMDRERQRRETYDSKQPPQQINSPSSVNNYSKSSRSPLSRSREDLYSSYVSSSEKLRKFTPSPIHHKHQQSVSPFNPHMNRNKQPQQDYQINYDNNYHNKMYDNRSNLNSSFQGHGYKNHPQQPQLSHHQSAPSLRQNLNPLSHRSSPVFNYDNSNYVSPVRDHSHYSPRPPMQMQQFHKAKEFDNNRKPNYTNRYSDFNYKGDSPSINPHHLLDRQPMKRNNLNPNNNKNMNYSPLRTTSSLSNTHLYQEQQQQHPPFKKQPNFSTHNNNNIINQQPQQMFTHIKPLNQKQQNLKNLKHQLQQKQQLINKQQKTKQTTNKLDDQGDEIEISSISNNSITEDIIEDIIEDDVQHTKILKDEENAKKERELKNKALKANEDEKEDGQIEDGEMKDDDDEEEEGLIIEKTDEDRKQVELSNEKAKENEDQSKKQIRRTSVDVTNKNDESINAFSDENFSEWSDDVEEYSNNATEDQNNLNNTEDKSIASNKVDNYDDVKFKIDELEAISDEEFDAIIDEQLENGMLSCKQVLDQLDINWASLIRDKDLGESQEEKDKKQEQKSKESSARSNFKSAQLLSQLGISNKFTGSDLKKLIKNYCRSQLNDKNFDFESSIAMLHSLASKKKRLNDDLPPNSQTSNMHTKLESLNDVESRNTLSDVNLINCKKKILSFNHLVQNLKSKLNAHNSSNQDSLSSNNKSNEETKTDQEPTNESANNINNDVLNKDELIVSN